MSPGEHRNFHSERFRPHWYISEFHDSIFQSVFKALNRFRKAVGVGVDYIAALVMSMPFAAALTQKNITVGRGVTIYVDDRKINPGDANGNPVEPMLYNGTTYLPIRAVSEMLDCKVDWDDTSKTATITKENGDVVKVTLGSDVLTVNNKSSQMDTTAIIKDDRTFIPVRFVAEALGLEVEWLE